MNGFKNVLWYRETRFSCLYINKGINVYELIMDLRETLFTSIFLCVEYNYELK